LFSVSLLPLVANWAAHILGLLARPVFKYSILHRPWYTEVVAWAWLSGSALVS